MDLFYRVGGPSGSEIGEMMEVVYSTVSMGRKRLRKKLKGDKDLSQIIKRVENRFDYDKDLPMSSPFPSG